MNHFFSSNLIFLRKEKRLTQSEAAIALDLKRNTYANYESGHTEPSLGLLVKIASFFGIELGIMASVDLSISQDYTKKDAIKKEQKGQDLGQDSGQDSHVIEAIQGSNSVVREQNNNSPIMELLNEFREDRKLLLQALKSATDAANAANRILSSLGIGSSQIEETPATPAQLLAARMRELEHKEAQEKKAFVEAARKGAGAQRKD